MANGLHNAGNKFDDHPLALAILREGLQIQDRFSAQPVYAKTGNGYLKSMGVKEITEAKKLTKKITR